MAENFNNIDRIVPMDKNFADWYTSVIQAAQLIMYSEIKGFMIFRPLGWAIWTNIKNALDAQFKTLGVQDVYMPLLIPYSEFVKEAEHVEGFAPELFMVDRIGDKPLSEPYAIRPTSEILFCEYFKNSIVSYKDLPLKLNQWTSVCRAEKNTRPFLRNCEFHWHETHCVFETKQEANDFAKQFLDIYTDFVNNVLDIPVIKGIKTEGEKFAGADITYTIEAMMYDGQALQSATSHFLGTNFAKSYGISYQGRDNKMCLPFTTSHGLSTRIIGSIIMVHGDDYGLVLPPSIAPVQVMVASVLAKKSPDVSDYAHQIGASLANQFRVGYDDSDKGMGYKINEQFVKGTPITIIVGPNDVTNQTVTLIKRTNNQKMVINLTDLSSTVTTLIQEIKHDLYQRADNHLQNNIVYAQSIEEIKTIVDNKQWAWAYFDGSIEDEKTIKNLTGATPRCIFDYDTQEHPCFMSQKPTKQKVIFARAY